MKRGKKLIVLLGVLVVLLGAAYAAALLNPEEEEETLTDREREVARSMNLSDEEFLAAKKAQGKQTEEN